jgi:hypothetical protein
VQKLNAYDISCLPPTSFDKGPNIADAGIEASNDAGSGNDIKLINNYNLNCEDGMKLCGSNCILVGSTCCANMGYPELDCPNSGVCSDDGTCTGSCYYNTDYTCQRGSAYYCTGLSKPQMQNPYMVCSTPFQDVGAIIYCCE